MIKFYDTNALFHNIDLEKIEKPFLISNLIYTELQNIKGNPQKSLKTKVQARKIINWLIENENKNKYIEIEYLSEWDTEFKKCPFFINNRDFRIIISALHAQQQYQNIQFITYDSNCYKIAKTMGLNCFYPIQKQDIYTGYKIITDPSEEELVNLYSNNENNNSYNLLPNEYLILQDKNKNVIDVQRFLSSTKGYDNVSQIPFISKMFGKIKAKDVYQKIAMDSLSKNKITVLRGPAGTGKSTLALGYLFEQLEKGKIKKIIIFCNPIATQGAAKLGYYPGDKDLKLLDAQIGNFLVSKLGSRIAVQDLINKEQLFLLPLSDIRSFDTGPDVGVYITQAQNLNIDLMKLSLQRVAERSFIILDGDTKAQVDSVAYFGKNNGLQRVSEVYRGRDIYGQATLVNIYRSEIAKIAELM